MYRAIIEKKLMIVVVVMECLEFSTMHGVWFVYVYGKHAYFRSIELYAGIFKIE